MKERDKKDEGKIKKGRRNSSKIEGANNIDPSIFFISCFHKDLWNEQVIFLNSKKNIEKIEFVFSYESDIEKNYIPKIYCIHFNKEQKRPKSLNLSITFDSLQYWELNELSIKEKTQFIFGDIKIIEKNFYEFIHYVNNELNKKNIARNNYCFSLDF